MPLPVAILWCNGIVSVSSLLLLISSLQVHRPQQLCQQKPHTMRQDLCRVQNRDRGERWVLYHWFSITLCSALKVLYVTFLLKWILFLLLVCEGVVIAHYNDPLVGFCLYLWRPVFLFLQVGFSLNYGETSALFIVINHKFSDMLK